MADADVCGGKHKLLSVYGCSDGSRHQNLWTRPLARRWTLVLFVGTCLLYWARMAMPICAVSMAAAFQWNKIDSGLVLGGFFWGYCFTQILGGHLSDSVGGERVLLVSTAMWALLTAATPLVAQLGSNTLALMTTARFLLGLLQGVFFPSLTSICAQRFEEVERGYVMSTMHSATYLGTLMAGGTGSILLDRFGWGSMFYCSGLLSALWSLMVWQCLLKGEVFPGQLQSLVGDRNLSLWIRLIQKPPVWAMIFAHMCIASTSYTLLSWLPTYFKESFPDAPTFVYNMIPWLVAIPSALGGGYVSDLLSNRGGYDLSTVRKIMQLLAMGGSSLFIMLLSGGAFTSFTSAVTIVSMAMGLSTFTSCGVSVNVHDLTPSCAGALYGFMNMLGAFMGLVLVWLSGYLLEVTLSWTSMFALVCLVNTLGLVVFVIFGDARRVDLDDPGDLDS